MIPFSAHEIRGALDQALSEATRETAIAVASNCILGTPVGNPTLWQRRTGAPPGYTGGHARRNWQMSNFAPIASEVGGTDAGGQQTLSIAKAVARSFNAATSTRLFLQNNAPYIGRLNSGHSTQAPAGFVEQAIRKGLRRRFGRRDL